MKNRVGRELKRLRLRSGYNASQLAKRLRTHHPNIFDIEKGKSMPRITTLKKFCDFFGVRLSTFFKRIGY